MNHQIGAAFLWHYSYFIFYKLLDSVGVVVGT